MVSVIVVSANDYRHPSWALKWTGGRLIIGARFYAPSGDLVDRLQSVCTKQGGSAVLRLCQ